MNTNTHKEAQIVGEFDEIIHITIDDIINETMENLEEYHLHITSPHPNTDAKKLARLIIETYIRLAHQEGRTSVLAELNHETRKLLDGFGHPKDCEMCRPINHERE